jgi:hypothetical protein
VFRIAITRNCDATRWPLVRPKDYFRLPLEDRVMESDVQGKGGADRVGSTAGPGRSMVCPSDPTVPPDPFQDESWRMKLSPGEGRVSGADP